MQAATGRRRGRGARLAAFLAVALAAACSSPDAPPGAGPSSSPSAVSPPPSPPPSDLAWSPCGEGFSCAVLDVPLVEDDPAQGTVPLALTRLEAADPANRTGSIVVNPGGPGVSATE